MPKNKDGKMSTTKIVYNACYGGFSLSREAVEMLAVIGDQGAIKALTREPAHSGYYIFAPFNERYNKNLVTVVEALGNKASGRYANLCIAEIEGDKYNIQEYDGFETVITPASYSWVTVDKEDNV
jgi:hypothetical protein